MTHYLLLGAQALTLLLPILVAGVLLILSKRFGWFLVLDKPIDFGSNIFGRNKTFRGLLTYLIVTPAMVLLIHFGYSGQPWISSVYVKEPIVLGLLWSGFYVVGELINSFTKRRLGISAGAGTGLIQRFFDNVDGMLASGIPMLFMYRVNIVVLLIAAVFSYFLHKLTDVWMRRLRLKKKQ